MNKLTYNQKVLTKKAVDYFLNHNSIPEQDRKLIDAMWKRLDELRIIKSTSMGLLNGCPDFDEREASILLKAIEYFLSADRDKSFYENEKEKEILTPIIEPLSQVKGIKKRLHEWIPPDPTEEQLLEIVEAIGRGILSIKSTDVEVCSKLNLSCKRMDILKKAIRFVESHMMRIKTLPDPYSDSYFKLFVSRGILKKKGA